MYASPTKCTQVRRGVRMPKKKKKKKRDRSELRVGLRVIRG